MFWLDRTAIRFESGRDAGARGEKGQQVHFERRKDVDHQRIDRGRGGGLGQSGGRQSPWIPGGKRSGGIQGLGRAREMTAARVGDFLISGHLLLNPTREVSSLGSALAGTS